MIVQAKGPEIAKLVQGKTKQELEKFVAKLSPAERLALVSDWKLWRLPYQKLPEGDDWRRVLCRMGRGAGKTYTGSAVTNERASELESHEELALIGRTFRDVRRTMVEGPSGILATAPRNFKPIWEPGNQLLTWPNGVRGIALSADQPEGIRGGNYSFVWADEPAFWPDLATTWNESVEPALRIGKAQAILTTTPLPDQALRDIENDPDTITITASTYDNVYLPQKVKDFYRRRYEGTRIGLQEIYGQYLEFNGQALWKHEDIETRRRKRSPSMTRVVVAVDPAVTNTDKSDETGIVVIGKDENDHGYVLADRSFKGSPHEWGKRVAACYHRFQADRVVAEVNNGGDLVESNILAVDPRIPVTKVNASRGKRIRAEPVATLYEKGSIHHVGMFEQLEKQMVTWDPDDKNKSPDRIDALVWGVTELLLGDRQVGPLSAYL